MIFQDYTTLLSILPVTVSVIEPSPLFPYRVFSEISKPSAYSKHSIKWSRFTPTGPFLDRLK